VSESDPTSALKGLLPGGLVPRLVVVLHAVAAVALLAFAALSAGQGALLQAGLMALVAAMLLTVGVAAGRLTARQ
jgi:hypothetical protein